MGNVELMVSKLHIKDEEDKLNTGNVINYDIKSLNAKNGPIFNFCPILKKYFLFTEKAKYNNTKCFFFVWNMNVMKIIH